MPTTEAPQKLLFFFWHSHAHQAPPPPKPRHPDPRKPLTHSHVPAFRTLPYRTHAMPKTAKGTPCGLAAGGRHQPLLHPTRIFPSIPLAFASLLDVTSNPYPKHHRFAVSFAFCRPQISSVGTLSSAKKQSLKSPVFNFLFNAVYK